MSRTQSRLPRISVIIPTYNRASLVPDAVRSALDQSIAPHEVLVVDDGSTDDTVGRLAGFDPDVRYVHQENRGVSSARNLGVRHASGEWVAFLDSDDIWDPVTLESLITAADRHPDAGLITMRSRILRNDGSVDPRIRGKRSTGPYFTTTGLIGPDAGGVLTPMVRRSLILNWGGFDEEMRSAEDCDLWVRLSFSTRLVSVSQPLLYRRRLGDNLTCDRTLNARMWLRLLDKLARDQPRFVQAHRSAYCRARGKELLRLGRGLLADPDADRTNLRFGRQCLRESIRYHPPFLRSYAYLALSYLSASDFGPNLSGTIRQLRKKASARMQRFSARRVGEATGLGETQSPRIHEDDLLQSGSKSRSGDLPVNASNHGAGAAVREHGSAIPDHRI